MFLSQSTPPHLSNKKKLASQPYFQYQNKYLKLSLTQTQKCPPPFYQNTDVEKKNDEARNDFQCFKVFREKCLLLLFQITIFTTSRICYSFFLIYLLVIFGISWRLFKDFESIVGKLMRSTGLLAVPNRAGSGAECPKIIASLFLR